MPKKKNRAVNAPSREERRERISNGTWMGRNTVFGRDTDYKRSRAAKEGRKIINEALSEK